MARPIEEWTEEQLAAFLTMPPWADRLNETHELCLGAQLPTRDGRACGNAHIIDTELAHWNPTITIYIVLTDAGTTMRLLATEVDEFFYPSTYICDVNEVIRKFGKETVNAVEDNHPTGE